ncbi:hypothetical protein HMPREF9370_0235 [Neisseria wadsworthii 9715]|uniref:Uncharacterized protein n=1 Tax=Neisseria wadsworthii 9715 TaxID=1030841 RepID=G4CMC6_9NEIS|nr:hypothetical protein HMPREF9370_0235 [Neisseria wadsworthii 9715]
MKNKNDPISAILTEYGVVLRERGMFFSSFSAGIFQTGIVCRRGTCFILSNLMAQTYNHDCFMF